MSTLCWFSLPCGIVTVWEEQAASEWTTFAVESLRKVTKNRGSFPTQEGAIKLLYLALQNVSRKWQTVQGWREALRQFAIRWPERMQIAATA